MSKTKKKGGGGAARRRHCGPIQKAKRNAKYAAMPAIVERNRRRKRLKHFKHHPNDLVIAKLVGIK